VKLSPEQIDGLRALRLYHYLAMVQLRAYANDDGLEPGHRKHYNKRANVHLGFVATLNDYFEIGDTAEGDADKCSISNTP